MYEVECTGVWAGGKAETEFADGKKSLNGGFRHWWPLWKLSAFA